jgi:hypothetical protein
MCGRRERTGPTDRLRVDADLAALRDGDQEELAGVGDVEAKTVGRRSESRLAVRSATGRAGPRRDRDVACGDPEVPREDLPHGAAADRPAAPQLVGGEPSRPHPLCVVELPLETVLQRGGVGEAQAPDVELVRAEPDRDRVFHRSRQL